MKLAKYCVKLSLELLKINLMIICILQLIKYFIQIGDNENESYLNYEKSFFDANNSIQQIQSTNKNNFLSKLTNIYSVNLDQIEITKTEHVLYIDNSTTSDTQPIKPIIKIKTSINLSEIIEFNLLKNLVKIAIV
ncbi:unnamed protein product, partial [Brachionus calyciflorus]